MKAQSMCDIAFRRIFVLNVADVNLSSAFLAL